MNDANANGFNLRQKFKNFLHSVVIYTKAYPIRFIFITDVKSIFQIEKIFEDILPPFELSNYINSKNIPRFHRNYVNVKQISNMIKPLAKFMNNYFNNPNGKYLISIDSNTYYEMEFTDKYNSTIYYISPYYQKIFPNLNKLVVMDTDMEFTVDPAVLFQQFGHFTNENILACGPDLAPHYYMMLNNAGYVIYELEQNMRGTSLKYQITRY